MKICREYGSFGCCTVDNRRIVMVLSNFMTIQRRRILRACYQVLLIWRKSEQILICCCIGSSICFHSLKHNFWKQWKSRTLRKGASSICIFSLLVNLWYPYFFSSVHESTRASFFSVGITGLLKFWMKNSINCCFLPPKWSYLLSVEQLET